MRYCISYGIVKTNHTPTVRISGASSPRAESDQNPNELRQRTARTAPLEEMYIRLQRQHRTIVRVRGKSICASYNSLGQLVGQWTTSRILAVAYDGALLLTKISRLAQLNSR